MDAKFAVHRFDVILNGIGSQIQSFRYLILTYTVID